MKNIFIIIVLSFFSGSSWGLHEKINHHWQEFHETFTDVDEYFWNPEISWLNKYKNRDISQGRTCIPVQFTDAKHLLASITQICLFISGFFCKRDNIYLNVILSCMFYVIGNEIFFNFVYR